MEEILHNPAGTTCGEVGIYREENSLVTKQEMQLTVNICVFLIVEL
jgi:hypothetical protein